ncbi:MAG TPA: ATP-binding cassette domain-containing protein [Candidatus Acidoferrales bacterium]
MTTPAHSALAVDVRDLWFSYATNGAPAGVAAAAGFALRNVEMSLPKGSICMVLGPSGCGKSTLLKVIKGLLRPQRGSVHVFGLEVTNGLGAGVRRQLGCRVAYIPQNLGLVRNLTALENTLMGALGRAPALASLAMHFPAPDRGEAEALLASLGIAHKSGEKVHNLSGGERQRVAIARALLQRPQLVLADEFVSQLDPVTTRDILAAVRTAAAGGVTFLITSHEIELVAEFGDRAVFMRGGQKVHECAAGEVNLEAVRLLMTCS